MKNALVWLLGAIAVVNFLAAAAVYLRGSRDKGTIATLERSNSALTENNTILTERVTLLEANVRADREKLDGQAETIEVLTNTVNSSDLIKSHHTAAMARMDTLHADLDGLPDRLAAVLEQKGAS